MTDAATAPAPTPVHAALIHEARAARTALEWLAALALGTNWRLEVTRSLDPVARQAVHHSARYATRPSDGTLEYARRTLGIASPAQTRSASTGMTAGLEAAACLGFARAADLCDAWESDVAWSLAADDDAKMAAILDGLDLRLRAVMQVRHLKSAQRPAWQSVLERAYVAARTGIPAKGGCIDYLLDGVTALPPRFARQTVTAAVRLLLDAGDHAAWCARACR